MSDHIEVLKVISLLDRAFFSSVEPRAMLIQRSRKRQPSFAEVHHSKTQPSATFPLSGAIMANVSKAGAEDKRLDADTLKKSVSLIIIAKEGGERPARRPKHNGAPHFQLRLTRAYFINSSLPVHQPIGIVHDGLSWESDLHICHCVMRNKAQCISQ